jgi:hypothetical protein
MGACISHRPHFKVLPVSIRVCFWHCAAVGNQLVLMADYISGLLPILDIFNSIVMEMLRDFCYH